jgi:hypothetical protein
VSEVVPPATARPARKERRKPENDLDPEIVERLPAWVRAFREIREEAEGDDESTRSDSDPS